MENEEKQLEETVGPLRRRRETMPDGRRQIIFYTFEREDDAKPAAENEVKENV
jgi:hypothetical protein